MGLAEYGCEGRRLLQVGVSGIQGRDAGGPAIHHHLQLGDVCGGATLGWSDIGERRRVERAQTRGKTKNPPLLRG